MQQVLALSKNISFVVCSASLVLAAILPAILSGSSMVSASQVTERKITLGTSVASATSVTYSVSFKPATSTGNGSDDIKGIVVDFCTSPLVGTTCTNPAGMSGLPTGGNISVTHSGATGSPVSFTVNDPGGGEDRLELTDNTGLDVITTGNVITFNITGITNPSGVGTFYARIITYNTTAGATNYDSSNVNANNPGTHLDDGGLALSTANQLTVAARVQETLQFCVGTTTEDNATSDPTTGGTCASGFDGTATCSTSVDLGVIDSTVVSISPVPTAAGNPGSGNACNGVALVRSNAANGTVVTYFAEADSGGTNHTRALRVDNSTCAADAIPSTTNTDTCFNSKQPVGTLSAGTEAFGMTVSGVNCGANGGGSYSCVFATGNYNLARDANYDGDGTNTYQTGAANEFRWEESSTAAAIASSAASGTKVIDDEALVLKFAAASNITTPTGLYGVTATFIATSTY